MDFFFLLALYLSSEKAEHSFLSSSVYMWLQALILFHCPLSIWRHIEFKLKVITSIAKVLYGKYSVFLKVIKILCISFFNRFSINLHAGCSVLVQIRLRWTHIYHLKQPAQITAQLLLSFLYSHQSMYDSNCWKSCKLILLIGQVV